MEKLANAASPSKLAKGKRTYRRAVIDHAGFRRVPSVSGSICLIQKIRTPSRPTAGTPPSGRVQIGTMAASFWQDWRHAFERLDVKMTLGAEWPPARASGA